MYRLQVQQVPEGNELTTRLEFDLSDLYMVIRFLKHGWHNGVIFTL